MTCNCNCKCNQTDNGSNAPAMSISKSGIQFIVDREGSRSKMYLDNAGFPTIGVGHLLLQSELTSGKIDIGGVKVHWRNGLTAAQISQLLDQDLAKFENAVNKNVLVPLNQNQFDTLVSFAFNVGIGAFGSSTLLKKLNARLYGEIPTQLRRWKYSGGKVNQGLVNRREFEVKLWAS